MKRLLGAPLLLVALLLDYAAVPGAVVAREQDAPQVLMPEGDKGKWKPDDPAARARHMKERFPGTRDLSLVKVLVWPEPASGVCWSEITDLERSPLDVRYTVADRRAPRHATALSELASQQWTKAYRTPRGEGFERRAPFRAIDLTLDTELRCRCAPTRTIIEGDQTTLQLRLRWERGNMPEVSTSASGHDGKRALAPSITLGSLVTYDFSAPGSFPNRAAGVCGAHVSLSLLVEPPIL